MTDTARIAALEAALEDVRARLDPQRLAQSMEFVWQPRGGEPRIINSSGSMLDYTPAIQFLNATAELDVPAQRVVVTPTGGGAAAYTFSDDTSPTATQRIDFMASSGPADPHLTLTTATIGTLRVAVLELAEDASDPLLAPAPPALDLQMLADSTAGTADGQFVALSSGGTDAVVSVDGGPTTGSATLSAGSTTGAPNNRASVACSATDVVGPQVHAIAQTSATAQGPPDVEVLARAFDTTATASIGAQRDDTGSSSFVDLAPGLAEVSADAETRTVLNTAGESGYVQLAGATLSRHLRGPFTATPGGAILPLTSGNAIVNTALFGASQAVFGGISSAPGDEACTWSWQAGPGANQVTISFTNLLSAGPSVLPTLTFMTVCDA